MEKKETEDDCIGCKIVRTLTLTGISGYLLYQRSLVCKTSVGHRRFLLSLSVASSSVLMFDFFRSR